MGPRGGSFRGSDPTGVGCPAHHGSRRQQRGDRPAIATRREDRTQLREPPLSQARSQQSSAICQYLAHTDIAPRSGPTDSTLDPEARWNPGRFRQRRSAMNVPLRRDFIPVVQSGTATGESRRRHGHGFFLASGGTAPGVSEVEEPTPSLHGTWPAIATPRRGHNCLNRRWYARRVLWLLRSRRWLVAACVLVGRSDPSNRRAGAPDVVYVDVLGPRADTRPTVAHRGGPAEPRRIPTSPTARSLESSAVLAAAASRVDPRITSQTAQDRVRATTIATNLVQITATGSSPRAAESLANAVADSLVVFLTSSDVSNGSSVLAGLEAQAAALTAQVNKYDQEIQDEQAAVHSAVRIHPRLKRNPASGFIDYRSVERVATASEREQPDCGSETHNAATNGGTEVIQHASSATSPSLLERMVPVALGAVLGFLVGAAYVVVRQRRSNLTTRDEIAAAAGVPVVLSSPLRNLGRSSDWLTLLRERGPSEAELWNVRKVLSYLDVPEVDDAYRRSSPWLMTAPVWLRSHISQWPLQRWTFLPPSCSPRMTPDHAGLAMHATSSPRAMRQHDGIFHFVQRLGSSRRRRRRAHCDLYRTELRSTEGSCVCGTRHGGLGAFSRICQ